MILNSLSHSFIQSREGEANWCNMPKSPLQTIRPPTLSKQLNNSIITNPHHKTSTAKPNPNSTLSLSSCANLIKSLSDQGAILAARRAFDEMPDRDVVVWTSMVSCYASNAQYTDALLMFKSMLHNNVSPNAYTISSTIKACKGTGSSPRAVHGVAVRVGVDRAPYVVNGLVDAYAAMGRCGVGEAREVFEGMEEKGVAAWTSMIATCTRWGDGFGAVRMFQRMVQEGVESNPFTSSVAIHACASICELKLGQQIHSAAVKSGHETNLPVANSLIDMYFKCHCISQAKEYFAQMQVKDIITWNTMIAGLDQFSPHESFSVLQEMGSKSIKPNCFTFTSIISACARLALLNCGQQVHAAIIRRGYSQNQQISNALINMYTKCGSIAHSTEIFNEMCQKDLFSYTSMMAGYGFNGYAKEAIELFQEIIRAQIQPDSVVFVGLLSACSHAGLIDEGLKYFNQMDSKYNVKPDMEVYGCVIDILGRAGRVKECYELIDTMPYEPDESIWGALLGACKIHGELETVKSFAKRMLQHNYIEKAETYVMLSNIYAEEGEWEEASAMRRRMRGVGRRKEAGRSWIEVREEVVSFVAWDVSGSLNVNLAYEVLGVLRLHMDGKLCLVDLESLT